MNQLFNNLADREAKLTEREANLVEREARLAQREAQLVGMESGLTYMGLPLGDGEMSERSVLQLQLYRMINDLHERIGEGEARLLHLRLPCYDEPSNGIPFADVVIFVQGRLKTDKMLQLHAHRLILSCKSVVFRELFDGKRISSVRIDDATFPVVRAMIKYCYTAEINFTDDVTPDEVLEVAHKYGVDLLQKVCEEKLSKTIDEENLPKRLKQSKKFEAKVLEDAASKYFKNNFDTVISNVLDELCDHPCSAHIT